MKKRRLRIGLDVDDVLYQCNEYALSLLRKTYGDLPDFDIHHIRSWGSQGNLSDKRKDMFSDPSFVAAQPLYEGAQKFVHDLCKMADVLFVTAVPPNCMSARAKRLMEDFPEVPAGNILIGTRKDVIDLDVLLDDAPHNIAGTPACYPVLMRRPWNDAMTGMLSVNSYTDFLHLARMIRDSFIAQDPDVSEGGVLCLVGPSGTHKTDIAAALLKDGRFEKPRTYTTRPRRPSEDENAYCFISEEAFWTKKEHGDFIETTVYSRYFYGTSEEHIQPIVDRGHIAVIPIDICGALTLKNKYRSRAMLVFTERSKEDILHNILSRPIADEDKVRRILSLDFEFRNKELCDAAIDVSDGAGKAADALLQKLRQL